MKHELLTLTIGHTKNINGKVVTRWTATTWEIGTWGKATVALDTAITLLGGAR